MKVRLLKIPSLNFHRRRRRGFPLATVERSHADPSCDSWFVDPPKIQTTKKKNINVRFLFSWMKYANRTRRTKRIERAYVPAKIPANPCLSAIWVRPGYVPREFLQLLDLLSTKPLQMQRSTRTYILSSNHENMFILRNDKDETKSKNKTTTNVPDLSPSPT